ASGCKGADLLGMGLKGGPETEGKPLTALVDRNAVEIIDNWGVAGMRATGYHNVHADRVFVTEELTFVRGGQPSVDERITCYPGLDCAAQGLSAVTIVAARETCDFVIEKAAASTSRSGGPATDNRSGYKTGATKAEAHLRSAHSFYYGA